MIVVSLKNIGANAVADVIGGRDDVVLGAPWRTDFK
jgi:hypothetical protein